MLWDIRTQVEAQLRRIGDAQQHWASGNGADGTHVARVLACTDEFVEANTIIRDTSGDLCAELVRLTMLKPT
jgi:hypothetical protein